MSTGCIRVSNTQAKVLNSLRERKRAGEVFPVEPILVSSFGLIHGGLTSIHVGGFGPDANAPAAYPLSGTASDLVGGIYLHPRFPAWYIRQEFEQGFSDLQITKFITSQLEIDPASVGAQFVLWAITQIYG